MHHGALLGGVNFFTGKQGSAVLLKAALTRQIKQKSLRLDVDQILRQIGKDMRGALAEGIEPARILGKRLAQIEAFATSVKRDLQRAPGGGAVATGSCHEETPAVKKIKPPATTRRACPHRHKRQRIPSASFSVAMAS